MINFSFELYEFNEAITPYGVIETSAPDKSNITINDFTLGDHFRTGPSETNSLILKLENRLLTLILDESGSMTWNDARGDRYTYATRLLTKLRDTYPGEVLANLIGFGGVPVISKMLVTQAQTDFLSSEGQNINLLLQETFQDSVFDFAGVRVVRRSDRFPTHPADGIVVAEGIFDATKDDTLSEGTTYYYGIWTFNKDKNFSVGKFISGIPQDRILPRGVNFATAAPRILPGILRDSSVQILYNFVEGSGLTVFDSSGYGRAAFIGSGVIEDNFWLGDGAGSSFEDGGELKKTVGVRFDGEFDILDAEANDAFAFTISSTINKDLTISFWAYRYANALEQWIIGTSTENNNNVGWAVGLSSVGEVLLSIGVSIGPGFNQTFSNAKVPLETWTMVTIVLTANNTAYDKNIYINGKSAASETTTIILDTGGEEKLYIGAKPTDSSNVWEGTDFFGSLNNISIHSSARSALYISDAYDREALILDQPLQGASETPPDNTQREVLLSWDIGEDFDFQGGQVKILRKYRGIPEHDSDGIIVLTQNASVGQFFYIDSFDFVNNSDYYYRVFTINSLGNTCDRADARILPIHIPASPADASESPSPAVLSVSIINGNKKSMLQWSNPFSSQWMGTKIFFGPDQYPTISTDPQGTLQVTNGFEIFDSQEFSVGSFIHRKLGVDDDGIVIPLVNGSFHYYTLVTYNHLGHLSEAEFIVGVPSSNLSTVFPPAEVEDLHLTTVNPKTLSIQWQSPIVRADNLDLFFGESALLFVSMRDIFGGDLTDLVNIKLQVCTNITDRDLTTKEKALGTLGPGDIPSNACGGDVPTLVNGGCAHGARFDENCNDERETAETVLTFSTVSSGLIKGLLSHTANTNILSRREKYEMSVRARYRIEDPDTSQLLFTFHTKPVTVSFRHPLNISLINKNNRFIAPPCGSLGEIRGQPICPTENESVSCNPKLENGTHINATNPYLVRVELQFKGESLPSNTPIDVALFKKTDKQTLIIKSEVVSIREGTYLTTAIQESLLNAQGNPTGDVINKSIVDIEIKAPILPEQIDLYVSVNYLGFFVDAVHSVRFTDSLFIQIEAGAPLTNGIDVAEQFATVWTVDPDDPTNTDKTITVPDGTLVKWELVKLRHGRDRPFYSVEPINELVSGTYSSTVGGVAGNVFFGPVSNIENHEEGNAEEPCCLGEEYVIKASVALNERTAIDQFYIAFPCQGTNEDIALNKKFFMNAASGQPGQSPNYIIWADGESLLKFQIAKNPALVLDSQIPGATCFRNCQEANIGGQLIPFPENHIIQITAPAEIVWNVEFKETKGTGTDIQALKVGGNIATAESISPTADASTVTAGIPISGDVTDFYVRLNKFIGDGANPQPEDCESRTGGGIGGSGELILSCEWENICKGASNCTSTTGIRWTGVSPISGSSTFISDDNLSLTLSAGGGYENGNPPLLIGFKEPLDVNIIEARVNGQRLSSQELIVDGISQHTIVVEIKFADKPVPNGTVVELIIDGADANIVILSSCNTENTQPGCSPASNGLIFTNQVNDLFINPTGDKRSLAYFTINPLPNIAFNARINITCRYDKLETVDREITRCVEINNTINVDTPDPELPPQTVSPSTSVTSNEAIVYDTTDDSYGTVIGANINRMGHFAGSISSGTTSTIYIFGGYTDQDLTGGAGITATSESFDVAETIWQLITDMPTPRSNGMTVVINDDIYCIGGLEINPITQQYVISRKIESYNTVSGTWNPSLAPMPEDLGVAFGNAQYDKIDNIYVLCGLTRVINNNQPDTLNERILRYTISSDIWTTITPSDINNYKRISPFGFFRSNPLPYQEESKKYGYIYGGSVPKTLAEINAEFNKQQNQALDDFRSFILASPYYLNLTATEQASFIKAEEKKINEGVVITPYIYPATGFKYKTGSEISGSDGILTLDTSDKIDNEWPILPKPRDRGQAVYVPSQDTAYFFGGANQNQSTTLNRVESIGFVSEANSYLKLTSFSRGRSLFKAVLVDTDIYFSGGLTSGHQDGYVQIDLLQGPSFVEARGTQSSGIVITLRDDAGELMSQDIRCLVRGRLRIPEIDDVLSSFLADRGADRALGGDGSGNAALPGPGETVDFAEIIKAQNKVIDPNSDQFQFNAAKKLDEQIFLFPVLYSQQEIVIQNGIGGVTLLPRAEDPLADFQRLSQFIKETLRSTPPDSSEKFQGDLTRDELAALGDALKTVTLPPTILDSNTVRNLYQIETVITIIDSIFFGQTVSDFDENIQDQINSKIAGLLTPPVIDIETPGNVAPTIQFRGTPISDSDCFLLQHISSPEIASADRPPLARRQQNRGPAGIGGLSQSGQCLFCNSLIPLKPSIKPQLPTSLAIFFNANDWVPQIKRRLTKGHSIAEVLEEIDIIDHEPPFGASQLYTAMKEAATVSTGDLFEDRKKSLYICSDNSENFSLITRNEAVDEINAIDGEGNAPVVYTVFSTSFPASLTSQLERTEVGDINKITKATGGQSSTLISTGFLDQILNRTIGSATGGLGWGQYKNTFTFNELSAITDVTTNFVLAANTQGFLRFRYSEDGFNFTDFTERFKGSQTVDFADFFARVVEFEITLTTGFSESITPEYDSLATGIPELSSITWGTSGEKEDFMFLNSETALTNAQQVAASFEGTVPASSIVEIGVASSNSHDWRDFQSPARPALSEFGKTFLIERTEDPFSLVPIEPLVTRDNLLYIANYGSWDPSSLVKLFKINTDGSNMQILTGFRLHPREGQVYFNQRQSPDSVFKLAIVNSDKVRIGLRLRNRLHTESISIEGVGYIFSTNDKKPAELSQVTPKAINVHVSPQSPDSNDVIFALYDYIDLNADKEVGTIIKWFKNGTQLFELNNKINWENNDLQTNNKLKPGDKIYFAIIPSDGRDFGTTIFSPSISIIPLSPKAEDLTVIAVRNNITNARFDTASTFKVQYDFYVQDVATESGTEVDWFVNGSLFKRGVFTEENEISGFDPRELGPTETGTELGINEGISAHVIGNEITVEVTPKTNLITGEKSTSESFSVVNSIPIISNIVVIPNSPSVDSTLQLSYDIDDPDIDNPANTQIDQSEIKWLVSTDGVTFFENTQIAGEINVAPFFLSASEKWKAQVTGFDGLDLSPPSESNVVTISPI